MNRDHAETLPGPDAVGGLAKPRSARTGLVVVLTFHGMIIAQAAIVLLRLVPQWAEAQGGSQTILPAFTRFLVFLSTWMLDHPFERILVLFAFLGLDTLAFLLTWRLRPERAVGWWMRGSVVVGVIVVVWLYGSLYLPMLALRPS